MTKVQYEVFASAARTSSPTSEVYPSGKHLGIVVVIDVTAINLTPSVIPRIQCKDNVSGKFITVLIGLAITTIGTTRIRVFPGMGAVSNISADDFLSTHFKILMTHADGDSITYSVGAELVG